MELSNLEVPNVKLLQLVTRAQLCSLQPLSRWDLYVMLCEGKPSISNSDFLSKSSDKQSDVLLCVLHPDGVPAALGNMADRLDNFVEFRTNCEASMEALKGIMSELDASPNAFTTDQLEMLVGASKEMNTAMSEMRSLVSTITFG